MTCEYKRVEMATTPENALVGLGLVLGSALDRKRTIAADILFEALLGSNEAPVQQGHSGCRLGRQRGELHRCRESAALRAHHAAKRAPRRGARAAPLVPGRLPRTCRSTAFRASAWKPSSAATSTICAQRDYGIADGVAIACDALSTWLYDDDAATLALKYGPVSRSFVASWTAAILRTCCASWFCKTTTWHWSSWCRWTPPRAQGPRLPSWQPSAMP